MVLVPTSFAASKMVMIPHCTANHFEFRLTSVVLEIRVDNSESIYRLLICCVVKHDIEFQMYNEKLHILILLNHNSVHTKRLLIKVQLVHRNSLVAWKTKGLFVLQPQSHFYVANFGKKRREREAIDILWPLFGSQLQLWHEHFLILLFTVQSGVCCLHLRANTL